MKVTFFGVRGSMPAAGAEFARYGGHTSCVAVAHDGQPPSLVLDAGTGLRRLAASLGDRAFRGSVLVGHMHWDHVHGMPFFEAGSRPTSRVEVRLPAQEDDVERVLERMMSPPAFPILPYQLGPGWSFSAIDEGTQDIERFRVTAREIPHKGGRTLGYRVEDGRSSLAYLSDHDPRVRGPGPTGLGAHHEAALELVTGVDLLVHDATISADEVPRLGFLGHACAEYALELGAAAGVGTVALFHHAYDRTDDELDALSQRWCASRGRAVVAREGMTVDLPPRGSGTSTDRVVTLPRTALDSHVHGGREQRQ